MRRFSTLLCLASAVIAVSPRYVAAGGSEFPASGTRNFGRGGSGFTRADDPTVMLRNPALLADLWDDMAYTSVNILFPKACFQATGKQGWNPQGDDVANFGSGPVLINPGGDGVTGPDGKALPNIKDEPYPNVCYQGPLPILPNVALSMKLAPNLGVGLGFFPPDNAALSQWGNRDGTVDTPDGKRASPTRWFRSHLNTSYFSALGAVGWRPTNWLKVGFGFQWALVVYSATEFTRPEQTRSFRNDIRVDVTGRDLFIPGLIGSVQVAPIDNLDIAIGFKWSDRVKSRAKLDITTGNWGTSSLYPYVDDGTPGTAVGTIPVHSDNRIGDVSAPPIWVPQLSLGVRYADRLSPRPDNQHWNAAHRAAGRHVEDSMATERWDIEANLMVYFNSANDVSRFTSNNLVVSTQSVGPDGRPGNPIAAFVGTCVAGQTGAGCQREVPTYIHGKTQYSLRVGGDYNLIPGVLALRAGFSYETDGQDVSYLNVTNYMLSRMGVHAGATWRVASMTDVSVGYAHFFQRDIALTVNPARPFPTSDPDRYHVVQGKGDGVAKFAIPDAVDSGEGPLFANAGRFYYHLDVVSVALAQHF
jgi:long-subunit fatty acid transport protein